ncbi:MAG: pantetheine-phosphate adenylyltransferase [Clostridia bacterium]|nr:pantetheine-phosphate adenylyltransferase [Clostridia bacterium]
MRTAIISGTFDPITHGHMDVITRAAMLFEKVVVAVSSNSAKKGFLTNEARVKAVKASVAKLNNVSVELCEGLLADFCLRFENPVIVRGARSGSDFDYERSLYIINKSFGVPETIVLPASSGLDHISSTYARELMRYNKSLENAIPDEAVRVIKEYLEND